MTENGRMALGALRWTEAAGSAGARWSAIRKCSHSTSRSAHLTELTRISMQRLLERVWRDQGFTAILVTHDVSEAVKAGAY